MAVESTKVKHVENHNVDLLKETCGRLFGELSAPGAVEATPNSSPESTLSSDEAQELKNFVTQQARPGKNSVCQHTNPNLEDMFVSS